MAGLWSSIKRLAVTDVGALLRGLGKAELDEFERVLIEADLGVAAAEDLVAELGDRVRRGKLKMWTGQVPATPVEDAVEVVRHYER